MKNTLKISALSATAFILSACGSSGDTIVFDTVLGPETDQQIESLPPTLAGDKDRATYSTENLKGQNMESRDGSNTAQQSGQ